MLRQERDEAFANFREHRDAVAARREAEASLVEYYREVAERVRSGEAPRRWLH